MIDSSKLEKIFIDCLFDRLELDDEGNPPEENCISVIGITATFCFYKSRLENHRQEIESYIKELPVEFKEGWSFLNLCVDKHHNLWTGEHKVCEILLVLSIALDLACFCTVNREAWRVLPGGMPYIQFEDLKGLLTVKNNL